MRHNSKPRGTIRARGAGATHGVNGADSRSKAIADVAAQVAALKSMTCTELAKLYEARFGHPTTTHNAQHLRRKLAAKIQLDAIPPEERERLELLEPKALEMLRKRVEARRQSVPKVESVAVADQADSTDSPPTTTTLRDPRIPPVGTVLSKKHKAHTHHITVLADGFRWKDRRWDSLSRIAYEITGTRWNGILFFGLTTRKPAPRKETNHS